MYVISNKNRGHALIIISSLSLVNIKTCSVANEKWVTVMYVHIIKTKNTEYLI